MTRARWFAIALAACGGSHAAPDAPPPPDAAPDAGGCSDTLLTGELVDWDSSNASFCGIFAATFTVHGDASRRATTAPNGRFRLCVAAAPVTQIDIAPPSDPSECTVPASSYTLPATLIASADVIASGDLISARMFTTARAPDFGYRADAAQLLVHVEGTPRAVSIDASSDPAQAFDGTSWAAGATGPNVYFPNVDPASGTTAVSVTGGALGTGSVPLAAGAFTFVTVVAN